MNVISPENKKLLSELYELLHGRGVVVRLFRPNEYEVLALLEKISLECEPIAAAALGGAAIHKNKRVATAACKAIAVLLKRIRTAEYAFLDNYIRSRLLGYGQDIPWDEATPAHVQAVDGLPESTCALGLLSCHRSGYVRMAALRAIAERQDSEGIPFILLRLADWVPQINALAAFALSERIQHCYLAQFIECLPLIEKLKGKERARRADTLDKLIRSLLRDEDALASGLTSIDFRTRRFAYQLALQPARTLSVVHDGQPDPVHLSPQVVIERGIKDSDQLVRRFCLTRAVDLLDDEAIAPVLAAMRNDSCVAARRIVLDVYADRFPSKLAPELESALLDKSASLREYARFHLRDRQLMDDFATWYREALRSESRREPASALIEFAISGLGEVGVKEDVELIERFVSHKLVSVRKAAIGAIARLDGLRCSDLFVQLLQDHQQGVSSASRIALEPIVQTLDGERIWSAFKQAQRGHVKRNAVRLFHRMEKWNRLSYTLMALAAADGDIQSLCAQGIQDWINQYRGSWQFTKPTHNQIMLLSKVTERAREKLSEPDYHFLKDCNDTLARQPH